MRGGLLHVLGATYSISKNAIAAQIPGDMEGAIFE